MTVTSEKTKQVYEYNANRVLRGLGKTDKAVFKNVKKVSAWIDSQPVADATKKAYYTGINGVIRDDPAYSEAAKFYYQKHKALSEKLKKVAQEQKLSESEKEKYMAWDDIMEVRQKMLDALDATDKEQVQDFLIVCLYTMIPPLRADYAGMKVVTRKPKKEEGNYAVLTKRKPHFVLNDYKTSSTYGRVEVPITAELKAVIDMWRDLYSGNHLLVNRDGSPMTENGLSQKVISIFQKWAGKNVGISMLRHSYITHMRGGKEMSLKEKEAFSEALLHSPEMNELYKKL